MFLQFKTLIHLFVIDDMLLLLLLLLFIIYSHFFGFTRLNNNSSVCVRALCVCVCVCVCVWCASPDCCIIVYWLYTSVSNVGYCWYSVRRGRCAVG